jgi:hypothetical protein
MTNFNEYLQYNPETGHIIWIKNSGTNKLTGKIIKSISQGYIRFSFNYKNYLAHRVSWYLYYGTWPQGEIDRINGIRNDNRISNLRDVTKNENQNNKKYHREKTCKYYTFHKKTNKWQVQKRINGKYIHLGLFKTKELALQFIQDNIHLFPGAKPLESKI